MGILQRFGTSYVHPSINRAGGPYILHPDSKSLPDQTYNYTLAMAIGRKFSLSPHPLMCF